MKKRYALLLSLLLVVLAGCRMTETLPLATATTTTAPSAAAATTTTTAATTMLTTATTTITTTAVTSAVSTTAATTAATTAETTTTPAAAETGVISPESRAAALYCVEDDTLLYGVGMAEKTAPASLTKLLTAAVALHYVDAETKFTVGTEQELVQAHSSRCLIQPGHRLTLYDLLTGMLMASGNDAAYTVAVSTARAVQDDDSLSDTEAVTYFCELMNDFAAELGMENSHFTTPDGWDDAEQLTTAADLLTLAKYALTVPEIREIAGTYQKKVYFASGENITWTNSNALLNPEGSYYCADAVGLKTGTTENAGSCLIAAFSRGEKTYLSVVLGCAADADRYSLTLKLLDLL